MLAIIGGSPERFEPYVELYGRAAEQFGTTAHPVGMHSPGFIADTDEEAARDATGRTTRSCATASARERGWPPISRSEFDAEVERRLPLHRLARDGRPQDRPRRSRRSASAASTSSTATGPQPISARLRAVELYGTKVVPMVRDILEG